MWSVPGITKSPCTEIAFCARADQSNNLWCHLACCAINCTAALRRTNIPLPCNGGFRQRILSPAFPRALGEPFIHSAYHPVPSIGGSLCVRLWFYFRFIGLKHLYHTRACLSTPNFKFYSDSADSGDAMLFLSSTNSFCTVCAG